MLLGSVTLQKIPWSWRAGIPGWNFNRMSDSEEHKNKVRRGNKGAADSGVSSDKTDDSSWLHKTHRSVSHLTNNNECREKCLCRQCRKWKKLQIKRWPGSKLNFSSFLRIQRNKSFKQSGPLCLLPLLYHHQVQGWCVLAKIHYQATMISPQPRGRMRLLVGYLHLNPPQPTIQVMRQTRGSLTEGLRRHYVSSKQEKNSIHLTMDLVLDQTQDPWSKGLCRRTPRLSCLPMMVRMALTCFWFHLGE